MFGECEMRTVTPCPRAMPIGYLFTQPLMEDTKPFAKHTAFGAPAVDTSYYKNTQSLDIHCVLVDIVLVVELQLATLVFNKKYDSWTNQEWIQFYIAVFIILFY